MISDDVFDGPFQVIQDRQEELPDGSYTARFSHEKGENAVLEKLGEETTELILAAKDDDIDDMTAESADLIYHLLVLLAIKEMELSDLREELAGRH